MTSLFSFLGMGNRSSQIEPEDSGTQSNAKAESAASPPSPVVHGGNALASKSKSPSSPPESNKFVNGAAQDDHLPGDDAQQRKTTADAKGSLKPIRRSRVSLAESALPPLSNEQAPSSVSRLRTSNTPARRSSRKSIPSPPPTDDAPGPLDDLFKQWPIASENLQSLPVMPQIAKDQASVDEVEVPNTQDSLPALNGPLSPDPSGQAVPESSAVSVPDKRGKRKRKRAEITMELSDGAELPSASMIAKQAVDPEVPQEANGDTTMIDAGEAPSPPKRRTKNRKSQQSAPEPPQQELEAPVQDTEMPITNGDTLHDSHKRKRGRRSTGEHDPASAKLQACQNSTTAVAQKAEMAKEASSKKRRMNRNSAQHVPDDAPKGETTSSSQSGNRHANSPEEQPILPRSMLRIMKAKRKNGFAAINSNENSVEESVPDDDADASGGAVEIQNHESLGLAHDEESADSRSDEPVEDPIEEVASPEIGENAELREMGQQDEDFDQENFPGDEQGESSAVKVSKRRAKGRGKATAAVNDVRITAEPPSPITKPQKQRKKRGGKDLVLEQEIAEDTAFSPTKKQRKNRQSKSMLEGANSAEPAEEDPDRDHEAQKSSKARPGRVRGAQAELEVEHTIVGLPDTKESGDFTADEAELLRRAIKAYQFSNDLSVDELVQLIQWTAPYGQNQNEVDDAALRQSVYSRTFWGEIYNVLPERKMSKAKGGTTGIQRYVRRNYHNFKGAGNWTAEEDIILKDLYTAYPNQWKKISAILGDRDATACRDRWRNYVQYGDSRNSSIWSPEEEKRLVETVNAVIELLQEARADVGRPPLGEYTSRDINWQLVSERVGTRSRLQCSEKWKSIKARGKPSPTSDEQRDTRTPGTSKSKRSKSAEKAHRSNAIADSAQVDPAIQKTPKRRKAGHEAMLWGDKLDVIGHIMELGFKSLDEIDWRKVVQHSSGSQGSHWSIRDRKKVLTELVDAVGEQESFEEVLGAILDYIHNNHLEELDERYDPFGDVETEDEEVEDEEMRETPALARKRKGKSNGRNVRTPRKTKTRKTPTSKKISKEFITESDEEL